MENLSKGKGLTEKSTLRVTPASDAEPQPIKGGDAVGFPLTTNPVYVGGQAVDQTTYSPNFSPGDAAPLPIDKDTGEVLVEDAKVRGSVGLPADAAASSDTGSFSIISFAKRNAQKWTEFLTAFATHLTYLGVLTETAPATDTASSGLNGRLQRIAQRLTSLIALLPSSIGQKASAGSLSVVVASDNAVSTQIQGFNGSTWDNIRAGISAVQNAITGFLNTVTFGVFNSTPPTLTNGQFAMLQMWNDGQLLSKVSGITAYIQATFTRPADTTAYAALDSVSNSTSAPTVITLAGAGRASGASGYITRVRFETDQSTCVARFKLHFFNASVANINDNAPHTKLWAQRASYVGSIALPAMATEGTGSTAAYSQDLTTRLAYQIPSGTSLFALVETLDAFTPASGQNFFLEVGTEQN